jgi:16S rRNA processing protein RimM
VVVDPETDFPAERFCLGAALLLVHRDTITPVRIVSVRFYKERPIVGFDGVGDLTAAAALAGAELRVPVAWLTPLPEGSMYRHDLVGCEVRTRDGSRVGVVKEVDGALGASRLVVDGASGEILVPLAAEICREIDLSARRITIDPPEGLLDLNVPMRSGRASKDAAVRTR